MSIIIETDNLYRALDRYVRESEHEHVAEIATRLLNLSSTDADAFQVKIAALLQIGENNAAIKAMDSSPRLANKMQHFRAYAYYRLGKYTDAQKILTNNANIATLPSMTHLRAQIAVKLGKVEQARKIYSDLISDSSPSAKEMLEDPEFLVNYVSVLCMEERASEALQFLTTHHLLAAMDNMSQDQEEAVEDSSLPLGLITYELVVNAAHALIQRAVSLSEKISAEEKLAAAKTAHRYLALARRLVTGAPTSECDMDGRCAEYETPAALDASGVSPSDLLSIFIQQALVAQLLDEESNATMSDKSASRTSGSAFYDEIAAMFNTYGETLSTTVNAELNAVVLNNSLSLPTQSAVPGEQRGETGDLGSSIRRLQTAVSTPTLPMASQRAVANANIALLYAHNRQPDLARETLSKISKNTFPADFGVLFEAFLRFRERDFEGAESSVRSFLQSSGSSAGTAVKMRAGLALSHMAALRHNFSVAAKLLREWAHNASLERKPAVLATLIALHERAGEASLAAAEIDSAITYLRKHGADNFSTSTLSETLLKLQERAAQLKANAGDTSGAITLLRSLIAAARSKKDEEAAERFMARLVMLCATSTDEVAEMALREALELTPVSSSSISGVNSEELLAMGVKSILPATRREQDSAFLTAFLPNGKRRFSPEKLEKVRAAKKLKRAESRKLPKNVTKEMVLQERERLAKIASGEIVPPVVSQTPAPQGKKKGGQPAQPVQVGPDPYRWMPKWERPNVKKGKGAFKGPQGSGIVDRTEVSKYEQTAVAPIAVDKSKMGRKKRR